MFLSLRGIWGLNRCGGVPPIVQAIPNCGMIARPIPRASPLLTDCFGVSQRYISCHRLQDHERIEGRDAPIAADVIAQVGQVAADCDLERNHCVRGGERRRFFRDRGGSAWDWFGLEDRIPL